MYDRGRLTERLIKLGIELDEQQAEQFMDYYSILAEWNQVMNLTAITDYNEVVDKHFVDSLSLARVCDLSVKIRVLDLGTGAGFPGIPLKIVYPGLDIVLIDSLNKRIKFLDTVIGALGLKNITAVHGRAEDYGRNSNYRENFDLCVSRAVANLSTLAEYCIPFVKKGGRFISYKSGNVESEAAESKKAVSILGGRIGSVESFLLPETDIERSFVVIEKCLNTPKAYPRNAGKPSREPLK